MLTADFRSGPGGILANSYASDFAGYDLGKINANSLFFGDEYVRKPGLFVVDYGDGFKDTFEGSGFRYDRDGVPTSGTIDSHN